MVVFCFVCFCFVLFFSILICFVLLFYVTLCRRARELPGLSEMSRFQSNFLQKPKTDNVVLHAAPESGPDLPAFPAGTGTLGPRATGFTANGVYSDC